MDLREITENGAHHPWEISRIHALRAILSTSAEIDRDAAVLDIGCGDAYVAENLLRGMPIKSIDGIDINLSDDQVKKTRDVSIPTVIHNSYKGLRRNYFTLILLLDVVEHIDHDESFLGNVVDKYLRDAGYCLITVPAFAALFSSHDRFMRHYRRYSRAGFISLLNHAGLVSVCHGYLFSSLLPIRLFMVAMERFFPSTRTSPKGIGSWSHSNSLTNVIIFFLNAENSLLIKLNRFGIRLPGLTLWALCKKRQS